MMQKASEHKADSLNIEFKAANNRIIKLYEETIDKLTGGKSYACFIAESISENLTGAFL
ncbi:hypothetical protein [Flavobacterium subsaxonicum]|uniref:hypothetical protein n=1 Tax=Flavobacterium subsaxonicum TaxID=426226 RepID=UPI0012B67262|nr:hypothetical protein [Flavobacterium subsaxonicum]